MNKKISQPAKLVAGQTLRQVFFILFSTVIFTIMCLTNPVRAQNSSLRYHGFNVDFAEISRLPRKDDILASVKRQIEIVEQVGLSDENLNFFKTVPVVMLMDSSGTPGIYDGKKKTVFLKAKDLAPDKPILLHEFLHAFHHQRIPQGFQNEQINQFYLRGKQVFPNFSGEYFLSNNREFFAVTASIYLFGNIPRPPYNRQAIKSNQPVYYKYLEGLFGERTP